MPLEPYIVMDARRRIFVVADEFLEALSERGLFLRAIAMLERAANPLLGSGLVIIVARLIAAPTAPRRILRAAAVAISCRPAGRRLAMVQISRIQA